MQGASGRRKDRKVCVCWLGGWVGPGVCHPRVWQGWHGVAKLTAAVAFAHSVLAAVKALNSACWGTSRNRQRVTPSHPTRTHACLLQCPHPWYLRRPWCWRWCW